jgi:hypothetical protein
MRRGPKFEITQDMAIENIKTVCTRFGVTVLTRTMYDEHGSFAIRAIERKWGWVPLCQLAGVQSGMAGKPRATWKPCRECNVRLSTSRYCHTCSRRIRRQNQGALEDAEVTGRCE